MPFSSPHSEEKNMEITMVLGGHQNIAARKRLLSSLTRIQIWLFPFVDGCHCRYHQKKKKKEIKPWIKVICTICWLGEKYKKCSYSSRLRFLSSKHSLLKVSILHTAIVQTASNRKRIKTDQNTS